MQQGLGIGTEGGPPRDPEADLRPGPDAQNGAPGLEHASSKEQELYNRTVTLFMTALYDKKMLPKHLAFIEKAADPVEGVAEVASLLTMRVYTKAREDGIEIPGDILLQAGKDEIVPLVVEVAEEAGIAEFDQSQIDAAFYSAADKFTEAMRNMGVYTDEQRAEDLQTFDQMSDSGEMEALLQKVGAAQQQEGLR